MSNGEALKPLKTWSHLAGNRRRPSEYEVVSTNLIYNVNDADSPFELGPNIPMSQWFKEFRHGSPLTGCDFEDFRDPDEMIYRSYNTLQDAQETYVEGLLDEYNDLGHDTGLDPAWLEKLQRLYTPGRYLVHTVQMTSHYLVQIVPSSTIRNCVLYQAADQMRWLSHIAYRTAELQMHHPQHGFGENERQTWEQDAAWQGFRELMEKVLITYDWGESFVALNLLAKPAVDEVLLRQLPGAGRRQGDTLLGLLSDSVYRDVQRSRTWSAALVRFAGEQTGNIEVIRAWLEKWMPLTDAAIEVYCAALPDSPDAADTAKSDVRSFLSSLDLRP